MNEIHFYIEQENQCQYFIWTHEWGEPCAPLHKETFRCVICLEGQTEQVFKNLDLIYAYIEEDGSPQQSWQ